MTFGDVAYALLVYYTAAFVLACVDLIRPTPGLYGFIVAMAATPPAVARLAAAASLILRFVHP